MNSLKFTDTRGDEYSFIRYSSNEIKVIKKSKKKDSFHQIDFSADAVKQLSQFISESGVECQE
jgi:hypothetical protein